MNLEKKVVVDSIEVVENGCVHARAKTTIIEDGKQISEAFDRRTIAPGDDYSAEDARVQAICAATHTADVVAAYAEAHPKAVPLALPEVEA
jgi:hypothetical protein